MAHQLRALVTIPMDSGIAADAVTNTFYVDGGQVGDSDVDVADNFHDDLTVFYQAIAAAIFPNEVAPLLNVRYYNLGHAKPRVPIHEETIAHGSVSGTAGFPHEVAVCLSFRGEYESGTPNARRRGRVFLGPVKRDFGDIDGSDWAIPEADRLEIAAAAQVLAAAGNDTAQWSIYSPTTDVLSSLDDAMVDVVAGWVDNAFDTIRSRGRKTNARTNWPIPG